MYIKYYYIDLKVVVNEKNTIENSPLIQTIIQFFLNSVTSIYAKNRMFSEKVFDLLFNYMKESDIIDVSEQLIVYIFLFF